MSDEGRRRRARICDGDGVLWNRLDCRAVLWNAPCRSPDYAKFRRGALYVTLICVLGGRLGRLRRGRGAWDDAVCRAWRGECEAALPVRPCDRPCALYDGKRTTALSQLCLRLPGDVVLFWGCNDCVWRRGRGRGPWGRCISQRGLLGLQVHDGERCNRAMSSSRRVTRQ